MTGLALGFSAVVALCAAALRFGGASLVRTPRADALHDAADGVPGAACVAEMLEDRPRLQPAIGMVHAALLVAGAIPGAWALTAIFSGLSLAASLAGLALVLVLAGDSLPRSWGRSRPRRAAYRFSRLLDAAVRVGDRASDWIADEEEEQRTDADPYDSEEIELISSVLDFTDAIVREVMVPRTDMVTVSAIDDTDHALDMVIATGKSRLPVIGEDVDDIVGLLYARDLLVLMDTGAGKRPVADLMRKPYFVPETKRVSELLRELQAAKVHMAVVVDEFGGTAGLVTIEDLLEELVGEIVDEYDLEEPMVRQLASGGYLVDARLSVVELGVLVDRRLPDQDWDTVGGLLLGLAGRVPAEGEAFELAGITLVAEEVQGRRVARVRVSTS